MMPKLLISLFDYTGNASRPYKENGWNVVRVDIKLGVDILDWIAPYAYNVGIIAMIPCTDYALSGAAHFKRKDKDGSTLESQRLVRRVKEIIDYYDQFGVLNFWQIENPGIKRSKLPPYCRGSCKNSASKCH